MQISITQEDINNGVKHSCTQCAGALALVRSLELCDGGGAIVSLSSIDLWSNDLKYSVRLQTPRPLQLFITAHDANARVFPMTFDLDLSADQLLRLQHGQEETIAVTAEEKNAAIKESGLLIGSQKEQDAKRPYFRATDFFKGQETGPQDR